MHVCKKIFHNRIHIFEDTWFSGEPGICQNHDNNIHLLKKGGAETGFLLSEHLELSAIRNSRWFFKSHI